MPSVRGFVRYAMCLVKRKPSKVGTSSRHANSDRELGKGWPFSRSNSKVTQHESSSSEFTGERYTGSQPVSLESQLSSSSAASKASLTNLRVIVGEGIPLFQYRELNRATEGFSSRKRIGHNVYRGTVRGMEVAITRRKKAETFIDPISEVKSLCSIHHTNVVSVIGACVRDEDEHVYGVYEYMGGSSKLRDCLRSPHSPGYCVLSSWIQRLQVAVDVAKGLEYLHGGAYKYLIHKDIKSNNILVDGASLRAKIANTGVAHLAGELAVVYGSRRHSQLENGTPFAFSRRNNSGIDNEIMEELQSPSSTSSSLPPTPGKPRLVRSRSRKLTGTRGYMAPEYISQGDVSVKTDVFGFGVILLELLSGQEPITFIPDPSGGSSVLKRITLHEAIRAIFSDEQPKVRLREWMDPYFKDKYPLDLALRTATLARACVDTNPNERPDMSKVAYELSKIMLMSEKWEAELEASNLIMSRTMQAR